MLSFINSKSLVSASGLSCADTPVIPVHLLCIVIDAHSCVVDYFVIRDKTQLKSENRETDTNRADKSERLW